MNIAIQGHLTRGKEVIQILESLGGKNIHELCGSGKDRVYHYHIDSRGIIRFSSKYDLHNCKFYTLKEFEKEFPFKIGDEVIFPVKVGWLSGKVTGLTYVEDQLKYEVDTRIGGYRYVEPRILQLYPMKKERNITLTLEKAKEWYQKGGELKEVALQAYSEEELTKVELPKTWEEFCDNYPVKESEAMIGCDARILSCKGIEGKRSYQFKDIMPSKKSAEAHLAMIQLEQLRDCYRGLFVTVIGMPVWCIIRYKGNLIISQRTWGTNETFLAFQSLKIAEEYLNNFEPLIKKAGDLI